MHALNRRTGRDYRFDMGRSRNGARRLSARGTPHAIHLTAQFGRSVMRLLRTAQSPACVAHDAAINCEPTRWSQPTRSCWRSAGRNRWDVERRANVHPGRDAREADENHDQTILDHGRAEPAHHKTVYEALHRSGSDQWSRTRVLLRIVDGPCTSPSLPCPPDSQRPAPTPARKVARDRLIMRASPCRSQPHSSQRLSGRERCRALPGLRRTRHRPP